MKSDNEELNESNIYTVSRRNQNFYAIKANNNNNNNNNNNVAASRTDVCYKL